MSDEVEKANIEKEKRYAETKRVDFEAFKASIDEAIVLEQKYNLPKRFLRWKKNFLAGKTKTMDDVDAKIYAEVKLLREAFEKDLAKVK